MKLLILGAGGHGHVVKETAEVGGQYDYCAFLDDASPNTIGKLSDYKQFKNEFSHAFVAIGNPAVRREWQLRLKESGYALPSLIHPAASVSPSSVIGDGSVVMAGAVVQANAQIGAGCILSAGAIVDHDAVIGDYCHINAGAVVPSMSVVESGTKVDYLRKA